jgi:heat shock protein HtpX
VKRTLQQQIEANRRASTFYSFLMIVLVAALGAAIGAYWAPQDWLLVGVGAGVVALIVAFVARFSGPGVVLSISHARQASPLELQRLENVVEEMAIAAGIPKPKVYVIDDSAANAFATGMDPKNSVVVCTTGLLQRLDRDELQGVMAHEIAHVRNFDIRLMTTLAIVAGLIPLMADFFLRSNFWGGRGRRSSSNDGGAVIALVIGLVLAILAPLFARMLELAVSRQREYLADATAAELTRYPEGLARALEKIAADPEPLEAANRATEHMYIVNPFNKWARSASSLFSTHPPTEERIRRLRALMGQVPPVS